MGCSYTCPPFEAMSSFISRNSSNSRASNSDVEYRRVPRQEASSPAVDMAIHRQLSESYTSPVSVALQARSASTHSTSSSSHYSTSEKVDITEFPDKMESGSVVPAIENPPTPKSEGSKCNDSISPVYRRPKDDPAPLPLRMLRRRTGETSVSDLIPIPESVLAPVVDVDDERDDVMRDDIHCHSPLSIVPPKVMETESLISTSNHHEVTDIDPEPAFLDLQSERVTESLNDDRNLNENKEDQKDDEKDENDHDPKDEKDENQNDPKDPILGPMASLSPTAKSVPTLITRMRGFKSLREDHIQSHFNLTKNIDPKLIEIVHRRIDSDFKIRGNNKDSEFVIFHDVPDRVISFILLFLAKPIVMKLEMKKPVGVRQIGVCPVLGTWNRTCRQILGEYQMDTNEHRVRSLQWDQVTVSKDNWETARWGEEDVFSVTVQTLGDVIADICMGLERYYAFVDESYPHLMFTNFCEES